MAKKLASELVDAYNNEVMKLCPGHFAWGLYTFELLMVCTLPLTMFMFQTALEEHPDTIHIL